MTGTERLRTAVADRYKIERELGQGGMATVYLAHDVKHDRKVALKVLRPELAAVIGAERFLQEIKVTANLQHSHILPLYDSGAAEGFLFYVMPYVEGETLRTKLAKEKQLGVEQAVAISRAIAAALEHAHRQGVIHRDIKPENILLRDDDPLIADFGIALALSHAGGSRLTETGLSIGTPHYMSPEQAMGDRELDARSDVYSLGAMLYEMLVGDPPYTGGTAQAIVAKVITEKATPVTTLRDTVPEHVSLAIAKALNKLPADRFGSAAAFAEALRTPGYVTPTRATAAATAVPGGGRRVSATWVTAGAAVLFAGLAAWGWLRSPPETQPVIRYTIAFPADEALDPQYGTTLALSPDGRLLAYASATERGSQLRVRAQDELTARAIPGTQGIWQPFFAPDGRRVAFITGNRELKIVSLTGEPPLVVADSGLWRNGGSWGPDGYLYVGWRQHGTVLSRIRVEGGAVEPVTTLDTARGVVTHAWPEVLSNGRGLLFTAARITNQASPQDEVTVLDLRSGEQRSLVQGIFGRFFQGYLVFVRYDGALLAAPFDQDRLVVTGAPVPLLSGVPVVPGPDVALSSSGRLVYSATSAAGTPATIVWLDRSGVATPVEEGWTVVPANGSPVIAPDGRRLAVSTGDTEGSDLWIKDLPNGPFTRLTFDGNSIWPAWHPDGRSIVFRSVQPGLSYDLFTKRADGTGQAEVLLDPEIEVVTGEWSADGRWLLVTDVAGNIYSMRPGVDSVLTPLLAQPFRESSPALSPDGRWLAYVSDESGRPEVYVRSFPNVADTKRQVSTAGGVEPRWAHSGRELFYKRPDRMLVAATVQSAPTFAVLSRQALFSMESSLLNSVVGPRYDVSPDDRRFLAFRVTEVGQGPGSAIVVENFLQELRAKVNR